MDDIWQVETSSTDQEQSRKRNLENERKIYKRS